jgi:hypothetical protein
MAGPAQRRRSGSGQLADALIWGAVLGAAAGAVLGASIDGVGAGVGALIGVALYAPAEAVTSLNRGAAGCWSVRASACCSRRSTPTSSRRWSRRRWRWSIA